MSTAELPAPGPRAAAPAADPAGSAATPSAGSAPALQRILLWDLPTRLFHWGLVLAVAVAVASGEVGGDWMGVHQGAGLTIVGLLVFRLVWGFVGSTYSRFASFAPTPRKLAAYLKGRWQGTGHNPLGAVSVLVLLALLAWQAGTGLFSNDEIDFTGPLYPLVSDELALRFTGWHRLSAWALFALVGLHVAAIAYHGLVRRHNLVRPMVTGYQEVASAGLQGRRAGPLALAVALVAALSAVVLVASGAQLASAAASAPVARAVPGSQ
jgi:cytochrome b